MATKINVGKRMTLTSLTLGAYQTNVYLFATETGSFVVDPGYQASAIMAEARRQNTTPEAIVLTHCHSDHCGAASQLKALTRSRVLAHKLDVSIIEDPRKARMDDGFEGCHVDEQLKDGQIVKLAGLDWRVIHTPGHTPGSMCLLNLPSPEEIAAGEKPVLIAGDTLFYHSYGRTDFPGGSQRDMNASLRRLLTSLPPETVVLPGHDRTTTIGAEQRYFLG